MARHPRGYVVLVIKPLQVGSYNKGGCSPWKWENALSPAWAALYRSKPEGDQCKKDKPRQLSPAGPFAFGSKSLRATGQPEFCATRFPDSNDSNRGQTTLKPSSPACPPCHSATQKIEVYPLLRVRFTRGFATRAARDEPNDDVDGFNSHAFPERETREG